MLTEEELRLRLAIGGVKFNENEARDDHGRWTSDDAATGEVKVGNTLSALPKDVANTIRSDYENRTGNKMPNELSPSWQNTAAWQMVMTDQAKWLDDPKAAHPENYEPNPAFGEHLKVGATEPKLREGDAYYGKPPRIYDVESVPARPLTEADKGKLVSMGRDYLVLDAGGDRPPDSLYRVMSTGEYDAAKANGYIRSDERMNLGPEGTVTSLDRTGSFYEPTDGSPYRIARIEYRDSDGWILDHDGYVKTQERIPFERIQAVTTPLPNTRTGKSFKYDENEPRDDHGRWTDGPSSWGSNVPNANATVLSTATAAPAGDAHDMEAPPAPAKGWVRLEGKLLEAHVYNDLRASGVRGAQATIDSRGYGRGHEVWALRDSSAHGVSTAITLSFPEKTTVMVEGADDRPIDITEEQRVAVADKLRQLHEDYPLDTKLTVAINPFGPERGTYGTSYEHGHIDLSPAIFDPSVQENVQRSGLSGYFGRGAVTDPVGWIVTHEYGHQEMGYVARRDGRTELDSAYRAEAYHDGAHAEVSTYAQANEHEAYAESFASHVYDPSNHTNALVNRFAQVSGWKSGPGVVEVVVDTFDQKHPPYVKHVSYADMQRDVVVSLAANGDPGAVAFLNNGKSAKYSPDQQRDTHGRWSDGSSAATPETALTEIQRGASEHAAYRAITADDYAALQRGERLPAGAHNEERLGHGAAFRLRDASSVMRYVEPDVEHRIIRVDMSRPDFHGRQRAGYPGDVTVDAPVTLDNIDKVSPPFVRRSGKAAHDVSDEPRDGHGRWTSGGGSTATATKPFDEAHRQALEVRARSSPVENRLRDVLDPLREKYRASFYPATIELRGVDDRLANEVVDRVTKFAEEFPATAGQLGIYAIDMGEQSNTYAQVLTLNSAIAGNPPGYEIRLNTRYYGDDAKFSAAVAKDATPSDTETSHGVVFHPVGTTQSVIDHELGHVLDAAPNGHGIAGDRIEYGAGAGGAEGTQGFVPQLSGQIRQLDRMERWKLSKYADQGGSTEAFAEAFSLRQADGIDAVRDRSYDIAHLLADAIGRSGGDPKKSKRPRLPGEEPMKIVGIHECEGYISPEAQAILDEPVKPSKKWQTVTLDEIKLRLEIERLKSGEFDEAQHPRDDHGRFTSTGGDEGSGLFIEGHDPKDSSSLKGWKAVREDGHIISYEKGATRIEFGRNINYTNAEREAGAKIIANLRSIDPTFKPLLVQFLPKDEMRTPDAWGEQIDGKNGAALVQLAANTLDTGWRAMSAFEVPRNDKIGTGEWIITHEYGHALETAQDEIRETEGMGGYQTPVGFGLERIRLMQDASHDVEAAQLTHQEAPRNIVASRYGNIARSNEFEAYAESYADWRLSPEPSELAKTLATHEGWAPRA